MVDLTLTTATASRRPARPAIRTQWDSSNVPVTRMGQVTLFIGGLLLVWMTAALLAVIPTTDLSIGMLVVLVEVIAIAAMSGLVLGVLTAVISALLISWYLAVPVGSFTVTAADTLTALVVYTGLSVSAAVLVSRLSAARALVLERERQSSVVSSVLTEAGMAGRVSPAVVVQSTFSLDLFSLEQRDALGLWDVVERAGRDDPDGALPRVVPLPDGHRLVVSGADAEALDEEVLQSTATAVLRAHQAQLLAEERENAHALALVDQARSALLASLGHDLRTPLAGLSLAVDGLRNDTGALSNDQRQELLTTAADSVQRLDGLVTNLLDSARLRAGVLLSHLEPTSVEEVAAKAVVAIGDPEVVDFDVDETLPLVLADPGLLERILVNLLSNALIHSGSDRVSLCAREVDSAVVLDVIDYGRGLTERAAGPHRRPYGPSRSPLDGAGLGMSIVDGFSEAMGVPVERRETPGGGLTMSLTLPTVS